MGFGARLPGTKLTFLSRLGATSGAPHRQCLFLGDLHGLHNARLLGSKMVNFDQCYSNETPKFLARCETVPPGTEQG
jgi:hypothetical protein